jgi:hypothetical protein
MNTPVQAVSGERILAADSGGASYVDWGAIAAGAFIAAAISSVFLAFGSAIGLSLSAMAAANSTSAAGVAIAAALWLLWVQVSSFMGGGYVAGRMRRRIGDAKPHEVEVRDGSHGLIVWAVGVAFGAVLAVAGVAGLSNAAGSMDYYADKLLRAGATSTGAASGGDTAEIGRILTVSVASATVDDGDRAYAVREIAARAGLSESEAEARFDQAVAGLKAQAVSARKYGILIAFLTAASLLVSAAAAWWAACAGGRHRDEGVDHSRFSAWR